MKIEDVRNLDEATMIMFDVPLDDRKIILSSIAKKFKAFNETEDNFQIVAAIAGKGLEHAIEVGENGANILKVVATSQLTAIGIGFVLGYLYRTKEAREGSI